MIASCHFFCSQFLECLSIGCWITWINPLIFWSPLSYCPCVYLFALRSSRFDFSCFHSVDFSCLFLLFFKKLLRYMCGFFALFFFFFATVSCYMAVSCSFTVLKIGGGGLGELVSSVFRLFVFFLYCLFFWAFSFFSVVLTFHVEHFP